MENGLNTANIQSINDCIRRMLAEVRKMKDALLDNTEFANNQDVIKRAFAPCPCSTCPHKFSKMDIYHRLILVDSLYSTNVNQMRSFGLEEMTDAIWELCRDENGIYSESYLAVRLHYCLYEKNNFFSNLGIGAAHFNKPVFKAFNYEYGYIKGESAGKAMSLLSKYFYFVALEQRVDDSGFGFPIYDSVVSSLICSIEKYIGISPLSTDIDDIEKFIQVIIRIVNTLEEVDPQLWNPNNSGKLKFELLDYFLWHISKAGEKTYDSLLTKDEYLKFHSDNSKLPQRIVEWKNMYNKIKL